MVLNETCCTGYPNCKHKTVEGYPKGWCHVTLAVSPDGKEVHAIGGAREPGDGDTAFIGLERIKAAKDISIRDAIATGLRHVIEKRPDLIAWTITHDSRHIDLSGTISNLLVNENRLRMALEAAKISHLVVQGDCWFSCPKSGESCNNSKEDVCECGADAHNAAIEKALEAHGVGK